MQASPEAFTQSNFHLVEEEVSKRVDLHVNMLLESALDCKDEGVRNAQCGLEFGLMLHIRLELLLNCGKLLLRIKIFLNNSENGACINP